MHHYRMIVGMSVGWESVVIWLPLGLAGLLSWGIWVYRFTLSHRARPFRDEHSEPISVVVPIFQEDMHILRRCLQTWQQEPVREVILVVDHNDHSHDDLHDLTSEPAVRVLHIDHTGKRSAMAAGARAATNGVVVFVDSDTAWQDNLGREIVRPFADPRVGGVGSRQQVAAPETSV